jgi:hypothetical protein
MTFQKNIIADTPVHYSQVKYFEIVESLISGYFHIITNTYHLKFCILITVILIMSKI